MVSVNRTPKPLATSIEPLEARCVFAAGSVVPAFGGGDGVVVLDHFVKQLIESGTPLPSNPMANS